MMLSLRGVYIRKLAQHARRAGDLVCSGDKGYYYAFTKKEADKTIDHLQDRANSLLFTINSIKQSNHYRKLKGK